MNPADMMSRPDLRIATHDFGLGHRDWAEVERACTAWLRNRGLLATQTSEQYEQAQRGINAMRQRGGWEKLRQKVFGDKEAK
jgi:hypothetical protein